MRLQIVKKMNPNLLQTYPGHVTLQVIAATSIITAISSIIIAFVAQYGSWVVMQCGIVQGLCHGFLFPCSHNLLSKWVPVQEKSRLVSSVYSVGPLGTAISTIVTGWISSTELGWPYTFYWYGAIGLLWTLLWVIFGSSRPQEHNRIDPQDKRSVKNVIVSVPTPSLPVWSNLISNFGQVWGFSTLLTTIPRYSAVILGYPIDDNGLLSATPYLAFWILSLVCSFTTDYIISHEIVTTRTARIIMNSIGLYVPGGTLLILATLSCLRVDVSDATMAMFIVSLGASSSFLCGYNVNHLDIAPLHAGTLMGITNGLGNISSIISPLIVQFIVVDETNATEWSTVFYLSAGMYLVSNTVFLIYSSGSIQPWNENKKELDSEDKL